MRISGMRKALKRIALGPADFPQQCPIGMRDPQAEVTVSLHQMGTLYDVTNRHFMACADPFTIGIALEGQWSTAIQKSSGLSLIFQERDHPQRVLGTIDLQLWSVVPVGAQQLCLFRAVGCRNCCLPSARLWARQLQYAWLRWRNGTSYVHLTAREAHSMFVFYICPRPVALVSVTDGTARNMFPMNLMGPIGNGYFSFALNRTRPATALVKHAGRIALSSVPIEQTALVYDLGKNHKKECIDWDQLPFKTTRSTKLELPVPQFSLHVREMEIESALNVGSHTLFIARILREERRADGLQFFVVHGMYQAWRQRRHAS